MGVVRWFSQHPPPRGISRLQDFAPLAFPLLGFGSGPKIWPWSDPSYRMLWRKVSIVCCKKWNLPHTFSSYCIWTYLDIFGPVLSGSNWGSSGNMSWPGTPKSSLRASVTWLASQHITAKRMWYLVTRVAKRQASGNWVPWLIQLASFNFRSFETFPGPEVFGDTNYPPVN